MYKLGSLLALALAVTAAACTPNTSTVGQRITCDVDSESGVILACAPGDDSGGANTCQDIDEDGDGQPEDDDTDAGSGSGSGSGSDAGGTLAFTGDSDDSEDDSSSSSDDCDEDDDGVDDIDDPDDDNDGIDDSDDCDETEGGDGDESDLPYNFDMQLGQTVTPIVDAFAEKGAQPAAIVSVVPESGTGWRLAELQSGATFTVTDADCSHEGNHGTGRDRVVVTWENADGSQESDHMTLRYCEE